MTQMRLRHRPHHLLAVRGGIDAPRGDRRSRRARQDFEPPGFAHPRPPLIHATNANVESKVLFTPDPDTQANRQPDQQVSHTHEAFESEEIQVEPGIDPETLVKQVRAHQALRAKGFVETSQGLRILQGVGTRIDLIETSVHPPDHLLGRIVVIRRSDNPGSTH